MWQNSICHLAKWVSHTQIRKNVGMKVAWHTCRCGDDMWSQTITELITKPKLLFSHLRTLWGRVLCRCSRNLVPVSTEITTTFVKPRRSLEPSSGVWEAVPIGPTLPTKTDVPQTLTLIGSCLSRFPTPESCKYLKSLRKIL